MGFIGGAIRSFSNTDPKTVANVKNPQIAALNNQQIGQWGNMQAQGEAGLNKFISDYLAGNATAKKNTGEETDAISRFYNGDLANQLQGLRARRSAAVGAAANLGANQALRSSDQSQINEGGTGGSYRDRLRMGAVQPYLVNAAVDNATQERQDLGYLTSNQVALAGQRTALNDALAARGLVPQQQREALFRSGQQDLGALTNEDQANTFYGLKKPKNAWADFWDSADAGILNGVSAASSVAGMAKARGGMISGPGDAHSDNIPIRVSPGEFVVPASAVRLPGVLPYLQKVRALGLRREAMGNVDLMTPKPGKFKFGGLVHHKGKLYPIVGYDEGGMVGGDMGGGDFSSSDQDWAAQDDGVDENLDNDPYNQKKKKKQSGEGGGYGGGSGLTGSAQQLINRASEDQTPTWMAPAMVPSGGGAGGNPMAAMPEVGMGRNPVHEPDLHEAFAHAYGNGAVPENFGELDPEHQRNYIAAYAQAQRERDSWKNGINPYE